MTDTINDSEQIVVSENEKIHLKGVRGAVARNMTQGWAAPQVCLGIEVNMRNVLVRQKQMQAKLNMDKGVSVTAFILQATATVLKAHPIMNALLKEKVVELIPEINLALAVSIQDGLATPVIKSADKLSLQEIADKTRELAQASRKGTLPPKAYQGGTFTVSNLGMAGIDWFTPIINPTQVGILGISKVKEQAIVEDGKVIVAPITTLTLVFDHRAVDGYPAAVFLNDLKEQLEFAEVL
jgi:pyruvate/2-oxoglutarate dehydrogenase complex dihydrolipoamide acyltransferase (E2) component